MSINRIHKFLICSWHPLIIQNFKHFQFPAENFTIMLFHYDGIVDEWNVFPWSSQSIHVVAVNQTKWYDFLPLMVHFTISVHAPSQPFYLSSVQEGKFSSQKLLGRKHISFLYFLINCLNAHRMIASQKEHISTEYIVIFPLFLHWTVTMKLNKDHSMQQ